MGSRSGFVLGLAATLALWASGRPCQAQTVIRDSAAPPADSMRLTPDRPPRPNYDTTNRPTRADSAPKPAAQPAPAAAPAAAPQAAAPPPPAPSPYPKGVCPEDAAGGEAPDILMVTFVSRAKQADREAALKSVNATLVAPDPDDPRIWYVHVASEGNEFVLRNFADRLIRARWVSEVGPLQCPARPEASVRPQ